MCLKTCVLLLENICENTCKWKSVWKYVWIKKCVEMSVMLFKNWKHVFKHVYQTTPKYHGLQLEGEKNDIFQTKKILPLFLWLY